ncbi:hypothetical protein K493DRAFT_3839 [Basidiobolus meristosporus CBS 931.73]|uniref:PHD-type domain-containing protein n=1 Tax=Basidiobolus meristosporus CBS 931.73 TaxID=1314790 RepID=A0A1Y1YLM5_9FUNG|nr:hypothetical protein K493DRAFT_3839 [Basidiobolus meristosporus CBS 931.73]|eukprot:ORX98910.1 hypothetical protein K493DRAFT_3839 [Basidiobolus meristosporus CBS 931.73]
MFSKSHQVTAAGQPGLSNTAPSKASPNPYTAIAESPRNLLTNSIEQLFYNGSVSAPFDLRVLQYACFQCKTRLLKHISNLNSRYTNPNLVHELCTPCKYVFLSISQKSNQKMKMPQQSDNCLINLDTNPLQSTLLKDVFFSVPSPEKCEADDLDLMKYDAPSRWADTSSPTLSPTDFLIDEGENLFGFDLDPDFSSDQSTFGSSDTESSETASVHSPQLVSATEQKDDYELASLSSSPSSPATTADQLDIDDNSEDFHYKPSANQKKRPLICSSPETTPTPKKLAKRAHPDAALSIENVAVDPCNEYSDEEDEVLKCDEDEVSEAEEVPPRTTSSPTIFETLSEAHVDWCRYCGTTEGVNWRPGPWGKRTLCNKHGCDYKGYGFACKLPRLNLTAYVNESIEERVRPVLQHFCTVCQKQESHAGNLLVMCEGCPKAFHQQCFPDGISDEIVLGSGSWFCDESCADNVKRRRIGMF